jgi:hypothetical protein
MGRFALTLFSPIPCKSLLKIQSTVNEIRNLVVFAVEKNVLRVYVPVANI